MPLVKLHNSPEAKKARRLLENKFDRAIKSIEGAGLDEKTANTSVKALQAKYQMDMDALSTLINSGKLPKEDAAKKAPVKKKAPAKKKAAAKKSTGKPEAPDASEL